MGIDEAKAAFDRLCPDWEAIRDKIETEQDTRFQVIDLMLTEVLGWDRSDIKTEPATDSGYIDYLLSSKGRSRLVIEAKRESRILVDSHSTRMNSYKAGGPALKSAQEGLEQAKRYCTDEAVLFAGLTSGFEWIAFWALRTDSKPPYDGKAIVFPDLASIAENFAVFYDLFSKEGVTEGLFQVIIHEKEGLVVQHAESMEQVIAKNAIRLLSKSSLTADLDAVFRRFFGAMSGEDDSEMLAKCFVESKESREADTSLKKITQNLLNRIDVVGSEQGEELQSEIRAAVESGRGEFVLIIGNKGAGKSTFIDRFFRLILERSLRDQCLVLRVDLADSTGDLQSIAGWLTQQLTKAAEQQLFGGKPPSYNQLRGMFIQEYDRWRHGEHQYLYERDKSEFKEKFGGWIAELIQEQPEEYLQKLLESAVKARKLMPCLILDNTDHFPQEFQESVFQFAQGIHRNVFSFVLCPITDRTIWQLSKSGPLQSYESRAFYLPVPSTKEVLSRRVNFLKEKTAGKPSGDRPDYFLNKGIRVTIGNIDAFAACVEDIFVNEEYIGRIVGWLSNHDIRRSLQIAQRVITSPTMKVESLVKAYMIGNRARPRPREIKRALVVGDHNYYNADSSEFILNLFSVSPSDVTSPLVRLSILRMLRDREFGSAEPEDAYVTVEDVQNYMEPMGVQRSTAASHIGELLKFRLIEPYDPTDVDVYEEQRVRVTHAGSIHYEFAFAVQEGSYMSQMALTTPLRSVECVGKIRGILNSGRKLVWDDWRGLIAIFVNFLLDEDRRYVSVPTSDTYRGQRELRNQLQKDWGEG